MTKDKEPPKPKRTADAVRPITRTDRVANVLRKARKARPGSTRAKRAQLYAGAAGGDSRVLDWLEVILAVNRGDIDAREALGLVPSDGLEFVRVGAHHLSAGDADAALAAGQLAVAAAPKLAAAWHLLGDALARKRKDVEALAALQQARKLDPNNVRVCVDIAEVHAMRAEYAAAVEALQKARALDPRGATPAGRRAQLLVVQFLSDIENS